MTKSICATIAVALVVEKLFVASEASALCGDVSGDGKRTTSDALAVLKSAVGQNVILVCASNEPSTLRYYNDFTCGNGSSVSQATFNGYTFSADGAEYSEYQVVDRTEIHSMQ